MILHQDGSLGVIGEHSMGNGSSLLPFVERHPGEEGDRGVERGG